MASEPARYSYGKDTGDDEDVWWVNKDGNKRPERVRWFDTEKEAKAACELLNAEKRLPSELIVGGK